MTEPMRAPGLLCTSSGKMYQLLGDDKSLYFVRLGPEDHYDKRRLISSARAFRPGPNAVRIAKDSIDRVHCTRDEENTTIVITWEEKNRRFFADPDTSVGELERIFSGTPLKLSGFPAKRKHAAVQSAKGSVLLLIACAALLVLRFLCDVVGLTPVSRLLAVGWLAIPPIWLAANARHSLQSLRLDAGVAAAFLACMCLMLTPRIRPDDPSELIPAGAVLAAVCVLTWLVFRRRIDITVLPVLLIAAALYAPGAALCINDLAPTVIEAAEVSVEEVANEYRSGEWYYYASVDQYGVDSQYEITRDEYTKLVDGASAEVRRIRGTLGCITTDVRILSEASATATAVPDDTLSEADPTLEPLQP